MGRLWFVGLTFLSSVFLVLGGGQYQFQYPLEDLIEKLPGQPKVSFRQFAGYVDVDLKHGRSLFYYFVEAEDDPDHRPLTLWLNGGKSSFRLLLFICFCVPVRGERPSPPHCDFIVTVFGF